MPDVNKIDIETIKSAKPIKSDETKHTIVVVGAGFAGYRFFAESLHHTLAQEIGDSVRYVIVDPRKIDDYGCGVAWNSSQSEVLLVNMHGNTVVFDAAGNQKLLTEIEHANSNDLPLAELFKSRKEIGRIIHLSFIECLRKAQQSNIEVHLVESRVTNVLRAGKAYKVTLLDDTSLVGHSVILATGHFVEPVYDNLTETDRYIKDPWNWGALEAIDHDANVALLGLGPSAVDALLVLREGGVSRIDGFSRSGLMQYPRPKPELMALKLINEDFLRDVARDCDGLSVDLVMGVVLSEYRCHEVALDPLLKAVQRSKLNPQRALRYGLMKSNEPKRWFGLAIEIEKFIPLIWHLMRENERNQFRRTYSRLANIIYGMAPPQALQVIDAFHRGAFETFGGFNRIRQTRNGKFLALGENGKDISSVHYDYVIDCTGFGRNLLKAPWLFLANMIKEGLVHPHPRGGAYLDFISGQLQDEDRRPTSEIYCLAGSMTIGEHLMTNGLGKVAMSAHRTSLAIHKKLAQSMRTSPVAFRTDRLFDL